MRTCTVHILDECATLLRPSWKHAKCPDLGALPKLGYMFCHIFYETMNFCLYSHSCVKHSIFSRPHRSCGNFFWSKLSLWEKFPVHCNLNIYGINEIAWLATFFFAIDFFFTVTDKTRFYFKSDSTFFMFVLHPSIMEILKQKFLFLLLETLSCSQGP